MSDRKGLSPREIEVADKAGVWMDRPGLGDEYPRMLYRDGLNRDHYLNDEPATMDGRSDVQTLIVESAEGELEAMEDGWVRTVAELKTEAAEAPRRGRPAKVE